MWTALAEMGGCRHLFYLNSDEKVRVTRLNWLIQPIAIMTLAFGKISVSFLILRIMAASTWRRWFLNIIMVGTFIFCILASILTFVQCDPVAALWQPTLLETGKAKCWPPHRQINFSIFLGGKDFTWLVLFSRYIVLTYLTSLVCRSRSRTRSSAHHNLLELANASAKESRSMLSHGSRCLVSIISGEQYGSKGNLVRSPGSDSGISRSACISASIKTSKLPEITSRSDITCRSRHTPNEFVNTEN